MKPALRCDGLVLPLISILLAQGVFAAIQPSARTVIPAPKPGLVLHVAPNGSDAAPGSQAKPFATLERARDEVRALKKKGNLPAGSVVITVHGGEYAITKTLTLSAEDSGSSEAPVAYCAVAGEKPVIRGGARLTGWQLLKDTSAYPQLPPESVGKVWVCDLMKCGVTNILPLKLGGFASGNGFKTHPAHELFFNGKAMQLSRGPNEGFLRISDVAVRDGTKGYDREGSKIGKFFYKEDRASRWSSEPDLLLYGYWFWDWADSYEKVVSIDPQKRLITLAEPWHFYGYSVGAPFYAINAISELDAPGEWYLDRRNGQLLFYAPSDPGSATVELSVFPKTMVEAENLSNVRFEGLTWELGCSDAIRVQNGTNCVFVGCTIRRFAGNGCDIAGGMKDGLLSCDIYSMGRGGVVLSGGDRKTLVRGEQFIENCDIHELSRIDHTYTPAVILDGVGNHVARNRFHDILSSAMRVGGNDHIIELNEVFEAVQESDDQGGADMFGNPTFRGNVYRFNYWHHIGNWRGMGEQPKCGQAGIRLDDAICGTLIYGNVFERCSAGKLGFGAVQIHGGKDNVVENNVFLDCSAAVSCSPWDDARWRDYVKTFAEDKAIDRALYLQRYPEFARLTEDGNLNHIRRNVTVRCGELLRRAPKNIDAVDNSQITEGTFSRDPVNPLFNRPGFDPIPVREIGLYEDSWRKLK